MAGDGIEEPNAARVYDYLLGGDANFEVDRGRPFEHYDRREERSTIAVSPARGDVRVVKGARL